MKTIEQEMVEILAEVGLSYRDGYAFNRKNYKYGGMKPLKINFSNINEEVKFGKYKGKTWNSVMCSNPEYLFWGLKNGVFAMDAELVLRAGGCKAHEREMVATEAFHRDGWYDECRR